VERYRAAGEGERVCSSCLHLPPLLVVKRMWKPDKVVAMFWEIPCRSQKLHFDKNANWKLAAMTAWLLPAVTNHDLYDGSLLYLEIRD
jgi:hypothetical protein